MTDQLPATTQPQRAQLQAGGAVGALVPQSLEEGFRLAQAMAMSGMTPRDIDTPEKVLVAIMAGAELGMKPFQAVQSFAIVNGRPSLWGDGLMALALTNGLDVEEWMEGEGDARVAFCRVTRPDNGKVVTRDYSVEKAKTARLWGKTSSTGKPSPWVTSPDRMLQMRARAYAIRDAAADVLRGMPIKEEVEDFIDANPGIMDREEKQQGTGLLAKLETAQTLNEAAREGFGIRNIEDEAAAATPEPKKRVPRKAKADLGADVLEAIAEAEPEIVAHVVEDHGGVDTVEAIVEAPEPPADAQVEEPAVVTPEPTETVADGHAEPGEAYFLGDKEAFPSGRRVFYIDGVEQKDTADDGTLPVYAEHAPNLDMGNQQVQTTDSETAETASSEGENAASTELDLGFDPAPEDPFATFNAAAVTAKTWADLRPALVALGKTDAYRARPHDAAKARLEIAGLMETWNEAGAKLDPVDDPWLFQCFVTGSDDVEAINGTLALVQDAEWFKKANEAQQSGIKRFAFARVQQIGGA